MCRGTPDCCYLTFSWNMGTSFAVCAIRKNDVLSNDCTSLYEADLFRLRLTAKIPSDYISLVKVIGEEIEV